MWKLRFLVLGLVLELTGGSIGSALEVPLAVSPGDASRLAAVESRCPTFNWGAVEGATGYELLVYRLGEKGDESAPVLDQAFAGAVFGWTPTLARCLERGARYAWSVRAVTGREASAWSRPSLFRVAPGPSEAEFEQALEMVRDYLDRLAQSGGEGPGVGSVGIPSRSRSAAATAAPMTSETEAVESGDEASGSEVGVLPGTDFAINASGYTFVGARLGIGNPTPPWPLSIQATQGVAELWTTSNTNGSVLELKSSVLSPSNLGAINFSDLANTPGQIAYRGDDAMTFRTDGLERMRLTAGGRLGINTTNPQAELHVDGRARFESEVGIAGAVGIGTFSPSEMLEVVGSAAIGGSVTTQGDVTNPFSGQGLVKAWAKINANGSVNSCWRCDVARTTYLLGPIQADYQVSFLPLGTDIQARPRLAVLDAHGTGESSGQIDLGSCGAGCLDKIHVTTRDSSGDEAARGFTVIVY